MKVYKKYLFLFFLTLLFFNLTFCFAADLEVQYPALINNSSPPTSTETPLEVYLKYIFDVGIFVGFFAVFLTFIYAGILFFLSPAIPNARAQAKDRIEGAISGLLILATCYLIITTINPRLAIFSLNPLEKVELPPVENSKQPGVYFHKETDCPENDGAKANISSIKDFGEELTNQIKSANIVHDTENKVYYISILYDQINYWGKCQYINPRKDCNNVPPFAASALIYQYNFYSNNDPENDGVYIYRKSFYEESGGWLKISNQEIMQKGIYIADLSKLKYQSNSKRSKDNPNGCTTNNRAFDDCILWKEKGVCQKRDCPNLTGDNIGSIKIEGNYIVNLIYFDEGDKEQGPWTYCQAFPTADDINKEGPKQIKWEPVEQWGKKPNFIMIIPVVKK